MKDVIIDILYGITTMILIVLFVISLISKDRESIMNNCLELGNSTTQCEKLFE